MRCFIEAASTPQKTQGAGRGGAGEGGADPRPQEMGPVGSPSGPPRAPTAGLAVPAARVPRVRRDESAAWEPRPGRSVPEPWGHLEDPDAKETQEFVAAQNDLFEHVRAQCDSREPLRDLLEEMMDFEKVGAPFRKGNRWYYFRNSGLQAQSVLFSQSRASPDEPGTVFLDPNTLSEDGTVALSSYGFSKDGRSLAYAVSTGGSDWVEIRLLGVAEDGSPYPLDDRLEWVKFSSISWSHDHRGFFYNCFPKPEGLKGSAGTETDANVMQRLCYHLVGAPQEKDPVVWRAPEDHPHWMCGAEITDDGEWLVLGISEGCDPVNRLFLLPAPRTGRPELETCEGASLCKLVDNFDAQYEYIANEGSVFTFKTNLDAPKYRLVRVDVADGSMWGRPEQWEEVLPESDSVLQWAAALQGDALITCYIEDAKNTLQIRSLASGGLLQNLELPIGSIGGISCNREDSEFFFKFTSFTEPGTIFRCDTAGLVGGDAAPCTADIYRRTNLSYSGFDPDAFETQQVFVQSKDGCKVPMFVIGPKELSHDGANLALLYGYGGFNISLTPSFSVSRLAFLLAYGGVCAVANLRGGGEYGEQWHKDGSLMKKQNVFYDFQACAEYLVSEGFTSPEKLAIEGGSNGGLLVGACLNQRPDLFACGLAHVGVMDMLRFHKFTIGHAWCTDYGCAEESDEAFEYLRGYSPLHNVSRKHCGGQYPACLVLTGDHDDRVVPLHSLKYVAELQYELVHSPADAGEKVVQSNPLVARIDVKSGHGAGKPTKKVIDQTADAYAFVAACTRTPWRGGPEEPPSKL